MSDVTIFEVRGNYPDKVLHYFASVVQARQCLKESPLRAMNSFEVHLSAPGVANALNRQFSHIDAGTIGKRVETGDLSRCEALIELIREVHQNADLFTQEEIEQKIREVAP